MLAAKTGTRRIWTTLEESPIILFLNYPLHSGIAVQGGGGEDRDSFFERAKA